jgi:PAS domain S-box-containing protein
VKRNVDLLSSIYDEIHDAIVIASPKGHIVYMNPSAALLSGYSTENTENVTSQELFPEAALQETENARESLGTTLVRKDGSRLMTDLHSSPLACSEKPLIRHIFRNSRSHPDCNQHPTSEIYPDDTTRLLLMNLMENMTDTIYFKDIDSRFILVNKAFCARTGQQPDAVIGKTDHDLFTAAYARKTYNDEQRIIATGTPLVGEEEKEQRPDGHTGWVSTTKAPLHDATGNIIGTFGVSRDISKRKALEEKLRRASQRAKEAAMAKSAFLANMSHEIRTPMNAVVGMSDLLVDSPLSLEQRECIDTIRHSSEVLLDIINNILDLSKIEAGKLHLDLRPFNLVQTVEKTVDILAPLAAEKNLELMHHFHGSIPETVLGDSTRIQQVIINLLSNAIKFTAAGEVLVDVKCTPTNGQHFQLDFIVRDTGIGMTKEQARRVFQPFEQADSSITRNYGGTGLGLAICKKLIEMMDGKMSLKTEENNGSEFRFSLPVYESSNVVQITNSDMSALAGCRALVVDDNVTSLKILRHELEKAAIIPLTFLSATEALEQLSTLDPVDMAILDYNMPEADGGALAQKLRDHDAFANRPILILSSSGFPRSGRTQVVDRWMTKPVKGQYLRSSLLELLSESPPLLAIEGARPSPPPIKQPLRILLAEDNKVNQMVTLRMLEKLGYEADVANDGIEAVEMAQQQPYELILMDIQMPRMDGLEATRILREKLDGITSPKIVGVSAHALEENRKIALAAGMDGYLHKPVRTADLAKLLSNNFA